MPSYPNSRTVDPPVLDEVIKHLSQVRILLRSQGTLAEAGALQFATYNAFAVALKVKEDQGSAE